MTQLRLVPDPEAHARNGDPETSHIAAASVKNITRTKERILACLITPAWDEEIIRRYRHYFPGDSTTDQSIRSRRSELTTARLIRFADEWAVTEAGRPTRVWEKA